MTVIIDGGAGVTFPDTVQQTNAVTNTGGNPRYYAARAWVNFRGTGTITIRAAANVSSITDNGSGLYGVNFTTPMPDANYSAVAMADGFSQPGPTATSLDYDVSPTASRCSISTGRTGGSGSTPLYIDALYVYAVFFR